MSLETRAAIVSAPRKEQCELCRQRIGERDLCIAANVYRDGVWHHIEFWHQACHQSAGEPYGTPASRVRPSRGISVHHTKHVICKGCGRDFIGVPSAKNCETCRSAA